MNSCIQPWDERRLVALPGDKTATLTFCADHFLTAYRSSLQQKDLFFVALSGGSTPKALFSLLSNPPYVSQIDWQKIILFWSDERSVAPDHIDSNYKMAMDAGFGSLGIPSSHIHRMVGEKNIEKEAKSYEELIQKVVPHQQFDYLMLGMGEDGHTASLFPGTKGLTETNRLVIANHVPQKNTYRMTLTYRCINAAKQIVLYVLGSNKSSLIREIYTHQEPVYPVEYVGTKQSPALWILDAAAAQGIFSV